MVTIQWFGVSVKDLKLKEGGGLETPKPMSRTTFADLRTPSLNLGVLQASIKCAVFRQDTPSKELRFLKRKHNSFHAGTRRTFLEVLVEVPDFVNAWKAHVLCNLQYDSFPRTGETCHEEHHCHPEASLLRRAE